MKKIILMGIISLSLIGCVKDFFTSTAKPDAITKSIMTKYNIQYLNEKKEAKKWLCNSPLGGNFRIHIEIDKKENFQEVKKAILHAYDEQNRKELQKYYSSRGSSSEEILRRQKHVSNIRIKRNKQVNVFNDKNISYTEIKSYTKLQYVIYYKKLGIADYKGVGTLTYKYGFIEPNNSNKAYFYTSSKSDYKGNPILRKNKNLVFSGIGGGDVYIHDFLNDDKTEYDNKFIKKTISVLKSNNITYKYISNEYNFVKGRAGYKELSFDE